MSLDGDYALLHRFAPFECLETERKRRKKRTDSHLTRDDFPAELVLHIAESCDNIALMFLLPQVCKMLHSSLGNIMFRLPWIARSLYSLPFAPYLHIYDRVKDKYMPRSVYPVVFGGPDAFIELARSWHQHSLEYKTLHTSFLDAISLHDSAVRQCNITINEVMTQGKDMDVALEAISHEMQRVWDGREHEERLRTKLYDLDDEHRLHLDYRRLETAEETLLPHSCCDDEFEMVKLLHKVGKLPSLDLRRIFYAKWRKERDANDYEVRFCKAKEHALESFYEGSDWKSRMFRIKENTWLLS